MTNAFASIVQGLHKAIAFNEGKILPLNFVSALSFFVIGNGATEKLTALY